MKKIHPRFKEPVKKSWPAFSQRSDVENVGLFWLHQYGGTSLALSAADLFMVVMRVDQSVATALTG